MNCPPQITDALEVLDREQIRLLAEIARVRSENPLNLPDMAYDQLMFLYKRRDQLANSVNNMRAFYDGH